MLSGIAFNASSVVRITKGTQSSPNVSGTDMEAQLPLAYGTALVLIVIILLVNLLANALRKYFEKKVKMN